MRLFHLFSWFDLTLFNPKGVLRDSSQKAEASGTCLFIASNDNIHRSVRATKVCKLQKLAVILRSFVCDANPRSVKRSRNARKARASRCGPSPGRAWSQPRLWRENWSGSSGPSPLKSNPRTNLRAGDHPHLPRQGVSTGRGQEVPEDQIAFKNRSGCKQQSNSSAALVTESNR
jgi:hypothetical protein